MIANYHVITRFFFFYFVFAQLWEKLRQTRSGRESVHGHTSEAEDEIQGDPQLAALRLELNNQKRR